MHEFDDEAWDDGDGPDDKGLSHLIDLWLSDVRPERYGAGDREWMNSVVEKVAESLKSRPDRDEVIYEAACRRVYNREGQATKRANRVLRDIAEKGALPIGWGDGDGWKETLAEILSMPLSLPEKVRVRLGAAGAADLEQWMFERIREEDKRRLAEAAARDGARLLIDWVRAQGVQRIDDLRVQSVDRAA